MLKIMVISLFVIVLGFIAWLFWVAHEMGLTMEDLF